jgi:hypothetical protein
MSPFTWCDTCRQIMVELLSVIDYLCFFFLFSLLATKVHNRSLCLLFVKSCIPDPLAWVCQTRAWVWQPCWTQVPGSKNLKLFKSTIGLQKQTLPHSNRIFHSYAIKLNCKLFFVCVAYFINLLYSKKKERKKYWVLSYLFQVFKNKLFFFICIVDENINFMFPSKCWTIF